MYFTLKLTLYNKNCLILSATRLEPNLMIKIPISLLKILLFRKMEYYNKILSPTLLSSTLDKFNALHKTALISLTKIPKIHKMLSSSINLLLDPNQKPHTLWPTADSQLKDKIYLFFKIYSTNMIRLISPDSLEKSKSITSKYH